MLDKLFLFKGVYIGYFMRECLLKFVKMVIVVIIVSYLLIFGYKDWK